MSDEAALLAAIYANPDDDTPRLVYADWLDEHGDPARAEFIRVQIRLEVAQEWNAERRRLQARESELFDAHREEWTAHLGPFDPEKIKVSFDRGFLDRLTCEETTASELEILRRVPGLRWLLLDRCEVPFELLEVVAGLPLSFLFLGSPSVTEVELAVLDRLSCWTIIRLDQNTCDPETWATFLERRQDRLAALAPEPRRAAALRALWHFCDCPPSAGQPVREVDFGTKTVFNAELRLLAAFPELEKVSLARSSVTAEGLEHLARLPNLKSLYLGGSPIESIAALAGCATLESLTVLLDPEAEFRDAGTEGLERLTNLRRLIFRGGSIAEGTVERVATLRQLRELDLDVSSMNDERCCAALSELTELEYLSLIRWIDEPSLRYLAPLVKLRTLRVYVDSGTGDALRYLAGLPELHLLTLSGYTFCGDGLHHLAALTNLRTLVIPDAHVADPVVSELVNRLPAVTLINQDRVFKSPRATITFRRTSVADFASLLLPSDWPETVMYRNHPGELTVFEDGWNNGHQEPVPAAAKHATIRLNVDERSAASADKKLSKEFDDISFLDPEVLARGVVPPTGTDTASCVWRAGEALQLVCVVMLGDWEATLDCEAPVSRFDEFRPLFEFVARSLRVGEAALEGVGEEVTVAVSDL